MIWSEHISPTVPAFFRALILAGCSSDDGTTTPRPTIEYKVQATGVVFDAAMNRVPNAAIKFENLTLACGERSSSQPVQATSNHAGEFDVTLVLPLGYGPDLYRIGILDTCSRLVAEVPGVGTDTMMLMTASGWGSPELRASRVALQLR